MLKLQPAMSMVFKKLKGDIHEEAHEKFIQSGFITDFMDLKVRTPAEEADLKNT